MAKHKKGKKKRRIKKSRLFIFLSGLFLMIFLFLYIIYHIISFFNPDIVDLVKPKKDYIGSVVLDPGHGDYDDGGVSIDGYLEKDITLAVALKIGKILENENIEVFYTRDQDEVFWEGNQASDLFARVNIANETKADAFISIHTNSSENYNDGAIGSEIWLRYTDDKNITLANNINDEMSKISWNENRGLKDEANHPLTVLIYNELPSILVELGFLSDDSDKENLISNKGQDEMAKAIAAGIVKTIREKP